MAERRVPSRVANPPDGDSPRPRGRGRNPGQSPRIRARDVSSRTPAPELALPMRWNGGAAGGEG